MQPCALLPKYQIVFLVFHTPEAVRKTMKRYGAVLDLRYGTVLDLRSHLPEAVRLRQYASAFSRPKTVQVLPAPLASGL